MFPNVSCTIAAVEAKDRKRLGLAVVARRTELGMKTTKALADRAELSARMLGDVENGRRDNFSPGAKAQIERALRWDPGSIDAVLEGKEPLVSGIIRGRSGKKLSQWTGLAGSDQTELQVYRLAHLVMDIRDLVRSQKGPLATALSSLLDEATELAVNRVAQWRSGSGDEAPDAEAIKDALWFIDETRGSNAIRRQGDIYVTDNDGEILWPATTVLAPELDNEQDGDRTEVPPPTEAELQADFDLVQRTGDSVGQALIDQQDAETEVADIPQSDDPGHSEQDGTGGEDNQDDDGRSAD